MRAKGQTPPDRLVEPAPSIQNLADYRNLTVIWEMLWQTDTHEQFGLPEQVDVVFADDGYRQLHDMQVYPTHPAPLNVVAVDKAILRAMKPGGLFVTSDNASTSGTSFQEAKILGRIDPDSVKAQPLSAGFSLTARATSWPIRPTTTRSPRRIARS